MAKIIKIKLETDDKKLKFRISDNKKYVLIYNKKGFIPICVKDWCKVVKCLKTKK